MTYTVDADKLVAVINKLCGTNYDERKNKGTIVSFSEGGDIKILPKRSKIKTLLTD